MGPGPLGYAGFGAIDINREIQQNAIADQTAVANTDNATWMTLSFLVGAAGAVGVWYFYLRPKSRR
jgi:hypothetical protein